MGKKRCTGICQKVKDFDQFNKNSRLKDGLSSKCRECVRIPGEELVSRKEIQELSSVFTLGKV